MSYEEAYEGMSKDIKKMLVLCNLYWAFWSLESEVTSVLSTFKSLIHGEARLKLAESYYE